MVSVSRLPSLRVTAEGGGARLKQTERGFTLQTLIVTAVLVLVAVGAALVLVAINRSSSDDFEEAGNIDIDAKCQTWEIHLATLEAAGRGGPEGNGGVFSSNIGCLAPCYWEITNWGGGTGPGVDARPGAFSVRNRPPGSVHDHVSKLYYYDDNRAPAIDQIRLGVINARVSPSTPEANIRGRNPLDHRSPGAGSFAKAAGLYSDEEWHFFIRGRAASVDIFPGRPVTQAQIAAGIPGIMEPNWFSFGENPGSGVLATGYPETIADVDLARYSWEDESWEVRADPGREVCEIVNVAHDDLLVCSSAAKDNLCEEDTS